MLLLELSGPSLFSIKLLSIIKACKLWLLLYNTHFIYWCLYLNSTFQINMPTFQCHQLKIQYIQSLMQKIFDRDWEKTGNLVFYNPLHVQFFWTQYSSIYLHIIIRNFMKEHFIILKCRICYWTRMINLISSETSESFEQKYL